MGYGLRHVSDRGKTFDEYHRVLKPGGTGPDTHPLLQQRYHHFVGVLLGHPPSKKPATPSGCRALGSRSATNLFLLFLLLGRLLPPASQRLVQGDHIEGLLDAAGFQLLTGIEQGALGDQHIKEIAQALVE